MRTTCTRRLEFDAAHRVLRHESKCATLHGHHYVVEVTCGAPMLDGVGRVVDFGVVREVVGRWLDENWDHTTIINSADESLLAWCRAEHALGKRAPFEFDGEPTAENMARFLLKLTGELLRDAAPGLWVDAVRVFETPNCSAEARA